MAQLTPKHLYISPNSIPQGQKERKYNPLLIVNFSHQEYLHLPKDHMVAFAEKECLEGEVIELCMMEELENDLPRN